MNAPALEVHPYCAALPEYTTREFSDLCVDVRKQERLVQPIVLYEGKILDGRHRYRACVETSVEVRTREFDPATDGDPIAFVTSAMTHRSLTPGQRAAVAVELAAFDEERERARERQREGQRRGGKAKNGKCIPASRPECTKATSRETESRERVAKLTNSSGRAVGRAARIKQEGDPALFAAIKDGRLTPNEAEEYLTIPASAQRRVVNEPDRDKRRTLAVQAAQRSASITYCNKQRKGIVMAAEKDFARIFLSALERAFIAVQHDFNLRDATAIAAAFDDIDMTLAANVNQVDRVMPLLEACALIVEKRRKPVLRAVK